MINLEVVSLGDKSTIGGYTMAITLPLEKMSTEEKISTMERIWDDLCRRAEEIPSPPWHKKILQQREECEQKDADAFIDWDAAKKNIRDSLS